MKRYFTSLYWNIRNKFNGYESPYCKNCNSCGENGCCSYLYCVFNAMDKNKKCYYPETYKNELLIRDNFMRMCFDNCADSIVVSKFIDDMYNKASEEVYVKK